MKVKYIRWSTLQQSPSRQLLDVSGFDLVLKEQVSGAIPFAERSEGKKLLKMIQSGQVTELHIEEFSRLGRNAMDTLKTLEICHDNGVNVVVMNMAVSSMVNGKPNPIFKLFSHIIAVISEQERESIKERTEAGKVAAKQRGVKFGRKEGTTENKATFLAKPEIKKIAWYIRENKYSIREIAKITDSSPSTVQKVSKYLKQD